MKLGKKLTYEELLDMDGKEVYVKDIHNQILKIPIQKCKVSVCVSYPDELFDWEALGYIQRNNEEEILDDYLYENTEPVSSVLLENSDYQFIYDENGNCEDGEFRAYKIT